MTRFEHRHRRQGPRDRTPQRAAEWSVAGSANDEARALVDAPHVRVRFGLPARVVGQVDPNEVIGALTAVSMLVRALHQLGLDVETRGWTLLVRLPGGDGKPTARAVALGHHPDDAGRLWWWVPGMRLHAIGPAEEVRTVADQIVRLLRADGNSYRKSEDKGR